MRSYDAVGWVFPNGYLVCEDCLNPVAAYEGDEDASKAPSPVFADSEWDSFPTCGRCGEAIYGVNLTSDGVQYHKEWLYGAGGVMGPAEAEVRMAEAEALVAAMSDHGVRVESVLRPKGTGKVLVMYVPEGYECFEGEHDFDGNTGECRTCGKSEEE